MSKYCRKVSKLYAQSVFNVLPSPLFCFQNCSNRLLALVENHSKIQADLVRIKRLLASVMGIRRLKVVKVLRLTQNLVQITLRIIKNIPYIHTLTLTYVHQISEMNFVYFSLLLIILLQLIFGAMADFNDVGGTIARRRAPKLREYPQVNRNTDHMRGLG